MPKSTKTGAKQPGLPCCWYDITSCTNVNLLFIFFLFLTLIERKGWHNDVELNKVNWWGHFAMHPEVPISFSLAIGSDLLSL